MRLFSIFLLGAVLLSADLIPAACTCNKQPSGKNITSQTDVNEIIYDLTIPWPFRRPKGDADGDGVLDSKDKCPGTPSGAVVDAFGCPIDSDGDGVFDGLDACPGTPRGATVDKRGCPKDSDHDGVLDGIDECAQTPAGAKVDKKGCPWDTDGDGVYDGIDRCPNTPADLEVDKFGCPVEITETETQFLDTGVIRASNITFETAKAQLKPESFKVLDEIGNILVQWPDLKIEIAGHTDSRGSDEYNKKLSERRAKAVYDYLVAHFPKIKADHLKTAGYGENKPIASNDTVEGRAQNRRVEFTVLNRETLKKEIEKRRMEKK